MRTIVIVIVFLLNGALLFASECDETVIEAANRFVQYQYQGKLLIWEKSENLILFSKKREALERKRDPEFGGRVLSLSADPLVIVDSYSLQVCNKINGKAEVVVKYEQLATTVGEGDIVRNIVPDKKVNVVSFQLIEKKGHWYIVDPPQPYVSLQVMKEFYVETIKSMNEVLSSPLISQAQKRQYDKYKKELSTIDMLK